jgi:DNA polymerase III subunit delta'
MSVDAAADAQAGETTHPRQSRALYGQHAAELEVLEAYRSGRMPHAWLIGGRPGIGKATLAYRAARFVLAHPDPSDPRVRTATSLDLDPGVGAFQRVAAQSHPDLLALERTEGDNGKLRTVVTVDQVRRTVSFFGSTAGEGGWRVCIVDSADELQNPGGANALLKVLEEPPARALFFLVSHAPGRLLPTLRSRCRMLPLRPLDRAEVARAAAALAGRSASDPVVLEAAAAADGSVGRALSLLDSGALTLRSRIEELLRQLPRIDFPALHALGESMGGADASPLATFSETVRDWLSAQLSPANGDLARLARVAEVWEKVGRATRDAELYNLERKPLVFSVFGWLAEAART